MVHKPSCILWARWLCNKQPIFFLILSICLDKAIRLKRLNCAFDVVVIFSLHMTFTKMLAKLVVHKFETGVNFKSLHVTFEDDDNSTSEVSFSEWLDGKTYKKKEELASRLVVKIVSDEDVNHFGLDSCANQVHDEEIYLQNIIKSIPTDTYEKQSWNAQIDSQNQNIYTIAQSSEQHQIVDNLGEMSMIYQRHDNSNDDTVQYHIPKNKSNSHTKRIHSCSTPLSPLEYRLEKVKENNARIMENIHMLNRTLNYTKNKEILEIVCPKSMRSYPCNTCGKCFVYETGLRRHYTMRHAITELQPRWQVVWTCIECFQVWPRQDLAKMHSRSCCKIESPDCVREIKTSSLLQCEFCEKVYTSIPRLLKHSKIHTTASNYECNACEMAFMSYKTAEQHWLVCHWMKMCYNFSLPKLLLCNACDRKFRNYEQLYNHRYKAGHFMTKTHCNQISTKSLGILVYQCEICSQWFPSIPPLQAHRNEYHPRYDAGIQCKINNTIECSSKYILPNHSEDRINKTGDIQNYN